ncbi:unnamed protein product [Trichogramma brassicae]|uniref:Inhibitor of growth protein n=1 Tax=Trichogramma brassicae TaxID=86971 RepID=A0A6H5I4J9_9HYME|nr:unnamed protein product [Trichogramma brassicae]
MTTAFYLEHYLDSLEHLPTELRRNFNLMRDLDTRAQSIMKDIDKYADEYLRYVKNEDEEKRMAHLERIENLYSKVKEYGDDKVQLAIQTYELVDKHIRRLDSDLMRFEAEIQDKAINSNRAQEESGASKKGRKKLKEKEKRKKGTFLKFNKLLSLILCKVSTNYLIFYIGTASSEDESKSGRKKKKTGGAVASTAIASTVNSASKVELGAINNPADVLDMPVDPNEPTYCICNQVSFGEMIGCDNPDCGIEWFHFGCVGLTVKPKGKWYCPKCSQDRKKK